MAAEYFPTFPHTLPQPAIPSGRVSLKIILTVETFHRDGENLIPGLIEATVHIRLLAAPLR